MAKINYFLCEYKQVSYVYCVSYNCCQQKKCSSTFLFFFVKQRGYFCWAFHIRFRAWLTQNLTFCFKRLVQYKALSDSVFFAFDKNGDKLCLKSHSWTANYFSLASKGSKISENFLFLRHLQITNGTVRPDLIVLTRFERKWKLEMPDPKSQRINILYNFLGWFGDGEEDKIHCKHFGTFISSTWQRI